MVFFKLFKNAKIGSLQDLGEDNSKYRKQYRNFIAAQMISLETIIFNIPRI